MRILPYLWQQRQQALDMGCDVLTQPLYDNVHEPKHLQEQQLCKQESVLESIEVPLHTHKMVAAKQAAGTGSGPVDSKAVGNRLPCAGGDHLEAGPLAGIWSAHLRLCVQFITPLEHCCQGPHNHRQHGNKCCTLKPKVINQVPQ